MLSAFACLIQPASFGLRIGFQYKFTLRSYCEKITKSYYERCLGGVDLVIAKKELPITKADDKPAKLNIQVKILTKLYSFTNSCIDLFLVIFTHVNYIHYVILIGVF
jgi:hypothetical protein